MMPLLEAVPNISEGTNKKIIDRIVQAAADVHGTYVLHVDANADANRTVITLVGTPESVIKSCFNLIQTSASLIDMRAHRGAHPRLGAVDVCPLVPVKNMTLQQAAACAQQLANDVAAHLHLPVYLYEANAASPGRKLLANIRRGQYEQLPEKLRSFPPDLGPCRWDENIARSGACVIGARPFLIAYNISLNTQEVAPAKEIAAVLREKNGGLKAVRAIGWYMPAYRAAQVSFNLTDYTVTGLAQVYQACAHQAQKKGLALTGSELIGLVPEQSLLDAGHFYTPHETDKTVLLQTAITHLQLQKIRPFEANERILEYQLLRRLQERA